MSRMQVMRAFRAIAVALIVGVVLALVLLPSQDPPVRYPYREVLEDLQSQGVRTIEGVPDRLVRDPEYHSLDEFLRLVRERNISTVYYVEILCPSANMVEFYFKEDGGYSDKYYHRSWATLRIPRYPGSCTTRESPLEILFGVVAQGSYSEILGSLGMVLFGWMILDLLFVDLCEARKYVREVWELILLDSVLLVAVILLVFLEGVIEICP